MHQNVMAQLRASIEGAAGMPGVDGPAKASFNVDDDPAREVIYQTYAFQSPGPLDEAKAQELATASLGAFVHSLAAHDRSKLGKTLYWRRTPVCGEENGAARIRFRVGIEGFSAIGHRSKDAFTVNEP